MSRTKRTVHLRSIAGGELTMCGRGGITFTAPITDEPDEMTCGNCRKTYGAIERNRTSRRLSAAADLAGLRKTITAERDRRSEAAGGATTYEGQNRHWGWIDALDWVLRLLDPEAERKDTR